MTLPSLKAWGFSLLRESLESTELNPDTFPDLKGRGLRPMIFGSKTTVARRCTGSVPQKRIKENTTQENSYGYALATTQNPYRKVTTDAGE
ncbi:MAG: hypothetical protein BRC36_16360 [Cyanobacteria bacterium QH_2_48_84]|nr:MAG: hypothetical protein BRC36_16360 [Cyanobacteria bacterium QH_2_48_84]